MCYIVNLPLTVDEASGLLSLDWNIFMSGLCWHLTSGISVVEIHFCTQSSSEASHLVIS